MKDFRISFSQKQFEDLYRRLDLTRMPPPLPGEDWALGTDIGYLSSLLSRWRSGYDWRRKEEELNQYPQFLCKIQGQTIHFFHIRSPHPGPFPLLLTHGWPDSFLRYIKVIPLLSDYDLVIPSLPGFAFSTLPPAGYTCNSQVAELWHILMTQVLGYSVYGASGGDMGRGVTCCLAAAYPEEVRGIHLTDLGFAADLVASRDEDLSAEERAYRQDAARWTRMEGAYIDIQSTKPQTLACLLSDSPAGMAAWITEKYHAWSDWELLSMDDLLDCLTLYWMTNTAGTSIRAYHGNRFASPPPGRISVPTALALFPHDVLPVPLSWAEKHFPLIQVTKMERGGHFTALEQPRAFADSVISFLEAIR